MKSNTTDKFYIPFVVVNTGPYVLDFLFQLVNVPIPSIKSKGCIGHKFFTCGMFVTVGWSMGSWFIS